MEKGNASFPVALPVSETMERSTPSQIPQEQANPNGALSLVASSCGVQSVRTKDRNYEVFTMHADSNGVPARLSNNNAPASSPTLVAWNMKGRANGLTLFEGSSPNATGVILGTLQVGDGFCGDNISQLTGPTGGAIGKIQQVTSCSRCFDVSGTSGEPLYRVRGGWCSGGLSIKELSTNTVIGRVGVKQGCCSAPYYSVSYPQKMPIEHKLLLIACMNMFQLELDSQGNHGMNAGLAAAGGGGGGGM